MVKETSQSRELTLSGGIALQPWHAVLFCVVWHVGLYFAPRVHGQEPGIDQLFSEISMSETVASISSTKSLSSTSLSSTSNGQVLGPAGLKRVFDLADIQSEIKSQSLTTNAADLVKLNGATDEPAMNAELIWTVDAEAKLVNVFLPLQEIQLDEAGIITSSSNGGLAGKPISGPRLLRLMNSVSKMSNVQLVHRRGQLGLQSAANNRGIDAITIRQTARTLSDAVAQIQPLVAQLAGTAVTAATSGKAAQTGAVAAAPATPKAVATSVPVAGTSATSATMVGTWSAKTSATDAWAVRLASDGTFAMVHSRSGKNTVSKGNFTVADDRLTLSESAGTKLTGRLASSSSKTFSWTLLDGKGNALTTLAFTKK